jgi:hypothetical protein
MLNVRSTCLFGIGAVALIAAACGARADEAQTAGMGELERALALLEEMDAAGISVDYQDERIINVIEDLRARSPIPFAADWEALRGMGINERDRVTLRLERADLSTVLAALAFQLGDEFGRPTIEIQAGRIMLTTVGATLEMGLIDVYDVRDLLADSAVLEDLRRDRPADDDSTPSGAEADAPAAEEDDKVDEDEPARDPITPDADHPFAVQLPDLDELPEAMPPRPLTPGEELLMLIAEHVDPEAWLELGGSRARISEREGVLLVTAPPTTHRKLRDALRRLRQAHPSAVLIEAAIVDLPREIFARLTRRYERSGSALGRAIMLADDADLRWQVTSAVALGDRMSADSEQGGLAVSVALTPRLDRETGILRVEVEVQSTAADDRRSTRTTITIPFKQGGAAIELPAATTGESVRLFVLIPQRM